MWVNAEIGVMFVTLSGANGLLVDNLKARQSRASGLIVIDDRARIGMSQVNAGSGELD